MKFRFLDVTFLAGGSVTRDHFAQALRVSTGTSISTAEVDLVYTIFDKNHDGKLDKDSLDYLKQNRHREFYQDEQSASLDSRKTLSGIPLIGTFRIAQLPFSSSVVISRTG